jgi:phenylacetate-CoA ligase
MAIGNRLTRSIYEHSPAAFRTVMASVYARGRMKLKYGPKYQEYFAELERTQWCSEDQLQSLQNEKLRRLADDVLPRVPFYQDLFRDAGIAPEDVRSTSDLARLPILEKSVLQERPNDFLSHRYVGDKSVQHLETSGTTGKALDVYVTQECLQFDRAITFLHRSWAGISQGDRMASFVGFPVVPLRRTRPPFWVHDPLEDRTFFSLLHMSNANLAAYAQHLVDFRPIVVMGYPSALYVMALYLVDARVTDVRPKAVFTGSETLLPHQRSVIEQAFGCRVFDHYGSTEYVANIVQCESGSYHVKSEYGVVEILRPDGSAALPGEEGELIATGLNNAAMPLVRYRLGDRVVPKSGRCDCGRAGRLVEQITGRVEDIVVTPDGRHVGRLDFVFKGMDHVAEAQLVQDSLEHLQVLVVPRSEYVEGDSRHILDALRERLGSDMKIEIRQVDDIPRSASGKFRYVVSDVPIQISSGRQTGDLLKRSDV